VYVRLDAGTGGDFTGFEPIPADGWLPPHSGFVYGVILNDRASLEVYGARMSAPPHVQPPVAPVLYFKPYNTQSATADFFVRGFDRLAGLVASTCGWRLDDPADSRARRVSLNRP